MNLTNKTSTLLLYVNVMRQFYSAQCSYQIYSSIRALTVCSANKNLKPKHIPRGGARRYSKNATNKLSPRAILVTGFSTRRKCVSITCGNTANCNFVDDDLSMLFEKTTPYSTVATPLPPPPPSSPVSRLLSFPTPKQLHSSTPLLVASQYIPVIYLCVVLLLTPISIPPVYVS